MAWQGVCRKGSCNFVFNFFIFFLDLIILPYYGCMCLLRAVAAAAKFFKKIKKKKEKKNFLDSFILSWLSQNYSH